MKAAVWKNGSGKWGAGFDELDMRGSGPTPEAAWQDLACQVINSVDRLHRAIAAMLSDPTELVAAMAEEARKPDLRIARSPNE